ncbi:DUF4435 domain-containing protein [Vibrio fluvialis]
MLDRIEQQVSRSGTAISIHKFRLLKNNNDYVFLFVEGEDDLFFYPQNAKNVFLDKVILPLSCYGKDGVIEVHNLIKSELSSNVIVGFFVDRDFDDERNEIISNDIYKTPTYSVENLVYNEGTFINLLVGRFGLTPIDTSYDKCLQVYRSLSGEYYNSVSLYNSWIYAQRNLISQDKKLNLPKKLPDGFVKLNGLSVECAYDLPKIESIYPDVPKASDEIIATALQKLSDDKPEFRFRGKFNWQFFAHVLSLLIEDANDKNKRNYLEKSVKFNIAKKDSRKFFEEISPFAKPPTCLLDYLNNIAA